MNLSMYYYGKNNDIFRMSVCLSVCLIIAKHNNANYKSNVFIGAGQPI